MWFLIFLLMAIPAYAQSAETQISYDTTRNVIVETTPTNPPTINEYNIDTCNQELFMLIEKHNSLQTQINSLQEQQNSVRQLIEKTSKIYDEAKRIGLISQQQAQGLPPVPQNQ